MKILSLFFGLWIVNVALSQTSDKRVYINPSFGKYRLTTDPSSMNNTPLMIEGKIGTDIGKHGVIGFQFSIVRQNQMVSGPHWQQSVAGPFTLNRDGIFKSRLTALGFFYERYFSIGKKIDLFPSVYIQYLDLIETESGNLIYGPYSSYGTYKRETSNSYSSRVGVNFNAQYTIGKSLAITLRFAQLDCRIWEPSRKNISAELPILVGVKFSY
jgi:hypothetical protein